MNGVSGATESSPSCKDGGNALQYPTILSSYNTTALRSVYNTFASLPSWLNNSVLLTEGYSANAVANIPSNSTAYAHRAHPLLLSPVFAWSAGVGNYTEATQYAEEMRSALVQGSGEKLHAYVNYAHGDEFVGAVYGYEQWRLEKLRSLKRTWDPENKFQFYVPIVG
jgi:hypothetical protein